MRLRHALVIALLAGATGAAWLALDLNGRLAEAVLQPHDGRFGGLALLLNVGTPYLALLTALTVTNLAALLLLAAAFREERNAAVLRVQQARPALVRGSNPPGPEATPAGKALGNSAQEPPRSWSAGTVAPWKSEFSSPFLELWNAACQGLYEAHPLSAAQLDKILGSSNFDAESSAVALTAQGALAGAVLALRQAPFEDDGYWWLEAPAVVAALLVAPAWRRKGAGGALLRHVECCARQRQRPRVFAGGLENFPMLVPGVPEQDQETRVFFAAQGYGEVRRTCHMEAELRAYRVPEELVEREERLKESGFSFTAARAEDVGAFRSFLEASTLDRLPRRLEKFSAEPERFFLAWKEQAIVGFIHVAARDPQGRTGIDLIYFLPEHRGAGLGSMLLSKAHALWKAQGASRAAIWTYPEAAARFYPRAGFEIVQEWLCHEKELEHSWSDPGFVKRWR